MLLYSTGLDFHHTSTAGRCIEYISDKNYCSLLSIFQTEKELSFSLVIGVARFCLCTFQPLYLLQHSLISMLGPVNHASAMIWLLDSASCILMLSESTQWTEVSILGWLTRTWLNMEVTAGHINTNRKHKLNVVPTQSPSTGLPQYW